MSFFPDSGSISVEELRNFIESNLGLDVQNANMQEMFEIMDEYGFDLPNADFDENNNSQAFIEPHKMSETYGMHASKVFDGINFGDHAYEVEMIRNQSGSVNDGPNFNFEDFIYYYPVTIFDHYSNYDDFDPTNDSIFLFSPVCSIDAESVIKPGVTENPLGGTYTILEFTVYHPKIEPHGLREQDDQTKYLPLPRHLVERWQEPDPNGARLEYYDIPNSQTINPNKQIISLKQAQLQQALGQTFFDYQSLPSDRLGYDTMEKIKTFALMGDFTERDSEGNITSEKFISKGAAFLPIAPDLDSNDPEVDQKTEHPSMSNVQVKFISGSRHAVTYFLDEYGNAKYKVVDENNTIQYISNNQQDALDYWRINFYERGEFFQSSGSDQLFDWVHTIGIDWALRATSSTTATFLNATNLILSFRSFYGFSELSLNEDVEDGLPLDVYPLGTAFPEYGLTQTGLHISSQYIVDIDDFAKSQIELAISKVESIIKNRFSFNILFNPMSPQKLGGVLAGARPIYETSTARGILKTTHSPELITSLQDISEYNVIVNIFGNEFKVIDDRDGSIGGLAYAYIDINVDSSSYYKLEFDASDFVDMKSFYADVHQPGDGPLSNDPENDLGDFNVSEGEQVSEILFTKALTTIRVAFWISSYPQTYEMSFVVKNLSLKKCAVFDRINSGACFIDEIDFKSSDARRIIHDDKTPIYYIILHELLHALGIHPYRFYILGLQDVFGDYPTQFTGLHATSAYKQIIQEKINQLSLSKTLADYYTDSVPAQGGLTSHIAEYAKLVCTDSFGDPIACSGGQTGKIQPSFRNEIMTPLYSLNRAILSKITIGYLDDIGYTVDYNEAQNSYLLEMTEDTSISIDPGSSNYDKITNQRQNRLCPHCDTSHIDEIKNTILPDRTSE